MSSSFLDKLTKVDPSDPLVQPYEFPISDDVMPFLPAVGNPPKGGVLKEYFYTHVERHAQQACSAGLNNMSSPARNSSISTSSLLTPLPSLPRQTTYVLTGALAGTSIVPIELLWQRFSASKPPAVLPFLRTAAPPLIYRAAIRFWVFDLTKPQVESLSIPTWTKGGLSGAAGGFAEICGQSLLHRRIPTMAGLANQTARLFSCFSIYTYLSTTLSPDQLPPRPFWYCWLLGATAGGLGSGIIARAEGIRGKGLWIHAIPKGLLTIGTVIAVQVTSCESVLQRIKS
ncbi:hypothetical protein MMC28_009922 [Mycoblastus sanguinarius]|nr:hypothetical protein [Mycoblastus sanguinarius]